MVDFIKTGGGAKLEPVQFVRLHSSRWRAALPWILALLVSTAAHVGMVETLPAHFFVGEEGEEGEKPKRQRPVHLAIRLMPPEPPPEEEPPEEQFVFSNPEVPENKPDETYQYSNRDQQSAQEEPPEELDPDGNPAVAGILEEASGIIQPTPGNPTTAQMAAAAAQAVREAMQAMQAMQEQKKREATRDTEFDDPREMSPPALPDFHEGEEGDGEGIANILKAGEAKERPDEKTEEVVLADLLTPEAIRRMQSRRQEEQRGQKAVTPQQQQVPRERLTLTGMVTPIVQRKSNLGVAHVGKLAINSRFSEYGDYQARLYDAIGMKWNDLNNYSRIGVADARSEVTIRFYVNKAGEVEDLEILESNATRIAEWRCVDAIKNGSPYWPWTADMVRVLGDRQPVTVGFLYW